MRQWFAFLCFAFASIAKAELPQAEYLFFADQLIIQYHLRSQLPLPPAAELANELINVSPSLQQVTALYRRETDAFKKKDLGEAIDAQLRGRLQASPSRHVSFLFEMYLEPYDFERRRFGVCFDVKCSATLVYPIHAKFGARKYELTVNGTPNRIFFSPEEPVARQLEGIAAKLGRRVPVLLVTEITGTNDEKKWSDGSPYRRLMSNIIGANFLAAAPKDPKRPPSDRDIVYWIGQP